VRLEERTVEPGEPSLQPRGQRRQRMLPPGPMP